MTHSRGLQVARDQAGDLLSSSRIEPSASASGSEELSYFEGLGILQETLGFSPVEFSGPVMIVSARVPLVVHDADSPER